MRVSSWICKQAAAQNGSLLMWFRVCGGVCVLLCGFEFGNGVRAGPCLCDCRRWFLFSCLALLWCTCECCAALLCLESLDSSWKSNLNTHTPQTLMTGLSPLPRSLSDNVQRKTSNHHAIWVLKIAQTLCRSAHCPFRFLTFECNVKQKKFIIIY